MRQKATSRKGLHLGALSPILPTNGKDSKRIQKSNSSQLSDSKMDIWLRTKFRWTPFFLFSLLLSLLSTSCLAQYRPNWASLYVKREIFVLNLEDGYFGCQVNESTDFLQLFELSKLCDGVPQCFQGSDEVDSELKCTDRSKCSGSKCSHTDLTVIKILYRQMPP